MPWHLSKSDPRKVYDSRHELVGVMRTPEQAQRIVTAANRLNAEQAQRIVTAANRLNAEQAQRIVTAANRLNEDQPEKIAVALKEPDPPPPLETFHHDDCCTRRLQRDANRATPWTCPKCGTEWKRTMVQGVLHWEPNVAFAVIPTRR